MQYSLNDFNLPGIYTILFTFGFTCIYLSWIYTRIYTQILHGIRKHICIYTQTYTWDFKEVFLCVLLILHLAKILFISILWWPVMFLLWCTVCCLVWCFNDLYILQQFPSTRYYDMIFTVMWYCACDTVILSVMWYVLWCLITISDYTIIHYFTLIGFYMFTRHPVMYCDVLCLMLLSVMLWYIVMYCDMYCDVCDSVMWYF